ncbi:MAG: hypothetical protein PHI02_05195 [Sulfurovaceae bacterium]|nr:hypothetical protein [Sulfurovaceae bacterium]
MKNQIKYLKFYYWIIIVFGAIITIKATFWIRATSVNFETLNISHFAFSGIGFILTFIPLVLLPLLAIKELDSFKEKNKLKVNMILVVIFLFFTINLFKKIDSHVLSLIPILFITAQIYILYKIKNEANNKTTE